MVDKTTHDDYIRLYKELINRIEHKENVIEAMTIYIAKHSNKLPNICKVDKDYKCNHKNCKKCVRNYFEEKKYG